MRRRPGKICSIRTSITCTAVKTTGKAKTPASHAELAGVFFTIRPGGGHCPMPTRKMPRVALVGGYRPSRHQGRFFSGAAFACGKGVSSRLSIGTVPGAMASGADARTSAAGGAAAGAAVIAGAATATAAGAGEAGTLSVSGALGGEAVAAPESIARISLASSSISGS